MAYYFENLKNSILGYFSNSKKGEDFKDTQKDHKDQKYQKERNKQDPEESSVFLDETERNRIRFGMKFEDEHRHNSIQIFPTINLPIFYGIFALLTITFMFIIAYLNGANNIEGLFTEVGPMKISFISLFNLPKANHFVFHLLNCSTAVTGFGLVYSIYMVLKMNFNLHSYDNFQYLKLFVAASYGFISNTIHFVYGAIFFMNGAESINELVLKEIHISLYEFLFYLQIFFSFLFGVFTLLIISSIKSKPSYSLASPESTNSNNDSEKWVNYKLLICIYLSFFSITYLLVNFHHNKVILTQFDSAIFKTNYSFLIAILPYTLYFLNTLLYVMYYGELKETQVMLNQSEKIKYDNSMDKNIL